MIEFPHRTTRGINGKKGRCFDMNKARWILFVGLLSFVVSGAAVSEETLVLRAGRVYPGDGRVIQDGAVLVQDGKIVAVGADISTPAGATEISRPDGVITAGLIDAGSTAGLMREMASGRRIDTWVEGVREVVPNTRISDVVDLLHPEFKELARNGVTTAYLTADTSSVIGAQGAVVKTNAGSERAEILKATHGIVATISADTFMRGNFNNPPWGTPMTYSRRPTTRMGLIWTMRKAFYDAMALRDGVEGPLGNPVVESDDDLRKLAKILAGDVQFRIQAKTRDDIYRAVRLSDEFGFDFVLAEATEAFRCLDVLKEKEIPVVFGPIFVNPLGYRQRSPDNPRVCLETPARMAKAGVFFALTANDLTGENSLPRQAGFAMRYGLSFDDALRSVTSAPARIIGQSKKLGRVETGYEADLVLWSGTPFQPVTFASAVVIGGKVVHEAVESK